MIDLSPTSCLLISFALLTDVVSKLVFGCRLTFVCVVCVCVENCVA